MPNHHENRLKREFEGELTQDAAAILKGKRSSLIQDLPSMPAIDFLKRQSLMLDEYFRMCFEASAIGPTLRINTNPYAIVALGGYGRQEQCLHSDIDLLFLFHKTIPQEAENLIKEVVYPLWDIGLDVGYAVRTVKECLSLAKHDFEILTPLLDARFVCGMSPVASHLSLSLHEKLLLKSGKAVIGWLVEANRNRHHQFGDSSYLLEPNLKEGQGGLRDYHTLLWIARILFGLRQPRDLEYAGCMSHNEFESLLVALAFIWNVRNRLHLMSGRKWDQLLFENQILLAEGMGYRKTNGQEPVEVFLSDLHGKMDFIKQLHLRFLYEQGIDRPEARKKRTRKQTQIPDLFIENDMLHFVSPEAVLKSPRLLILIFEESLRLKMPLSGEAKRLIQELAPRIKEGAGEVVRSFERILSTSKGFGVLKEMLDSGFLSAFIPQFKNVIHRIQYDAYHLFPVDLHLLHTVDTLHRLGEADDKSVDAMTTQLFRETPNRTLLFWAALLHDIGKGASEGDHAGKGAVMAREVMEAKGYSPEEAGTVAFLVKEHLFLIQIATRRDLQDEETAIFCARHIKDPERLKMLYLLTVADSMATGPKAWTSWTASLLRDLFLKTLRILEKKELATREITERVELKKATLLETAASAGKTTETEALIDGLSPRYLIAVPAETILKHEDLYRRLGEKAFTWQVSRGEDSPTREVTLCAKDRPGLFSKIAGVFTLNGIDILDVQAFTWKNGTALDIFVVKPPVDLFFEEQRWARAEKDLESALSGDLDLSKALKNKIAAAGGAPRIRGAKRPPRIVVDNASSSFFTLLEVYADDFPGILYAISNAIFQCGLDIRVAKISTKVDQVVDVFYVRDLEAQKVDSPDQEAAIRKALESVINNPFSMDSPTVKNGHS